ncbi:DUF2553 family protein [Salipaludibacillus sp. CF4.18]|uniref:DUF2553 family protein n=1 Tax=Salipaludibacillus sp. CF4.18 TaxID=3373081 RepID=UPI003EE4EA8D
MQQNDITENTSNNDQENTMNNNVDGLEASPTSLVDISDQVEKKDEAGETALYFNAEKIGQIRKKGHSQMYEMSEGFEFENEKFFKDAQAKKTKPPESYVEGCDMGWC